MRSFLRSFLWSFSAILGRFKSFFRSFFTSDSLDKIVMTFYLKSHLFISSATSHPILRRSHHRSRHGDAPAPPMIFVFILVTSPVRARRATPRLRPFHPSPTRLRTLKISTPRPLFHPKFRHKICAKYLYPPPLCPIACMILWNVMGWVRTMRNTPQPEIA